MTWPLPLTLKVKVNHEGQNFENLAFCALLKSYIIFVNLTSRDLDNDL